MGNAWELSIADFWNGPAAMRFRNYRREKPLPVCYRCGVKDIAEIRA